MKIINNTKFLLSSIRQRPVLFRFFMLLLFPLLLVICIGYFNMDTVLCQPTGSSGEAGFDELSPPVNYDTKPQLEDRNSQVFVDAQGEFRRIYDPYYVYYDTGSMEGENASVNSGIQELPSHVTPQSSNLNSSESLNSSTRATLGVESSVNTTDEGASSSSGSSTPTVHELNANTSPSSSLLVEGVNNSVRSNIQELGVETSERSSLFV